VKYWIGRFEDFIAHAALRLGEFIEEKIADPLKRWAVSYYFKDMDNK
jgi:hypothetical protein